MNDLYINEDDMSRTLCFAAIGFSSIVFIVVGFHFMLFIMLRALEQLSDS